MLNRNVDVIVIGGGISGLAAAWALQRRGVSVMLLEAAARAGGTIGSAREQDCLFEAGPNSTLETTPLIGSLLDELGIIGERIYANPEARNRYILRNSRLIALPHQDPADRFIAATALVRGFTLATSDKHLLNYRSIRTLANR